MTEYSRMVKGHFTSTGGAKIINLPFKPDAVELFNYSVANSAATSQNISKAYWDADMGQGFAMIEGYNATPALINDTVIANGISTFSAGLLLQYGPVLAISGITKAAAGVVTTTAAHGLTSGDVVIMYGLNQSATTGMQQIAGIPFTVTVTSPTAFSIPWNTNQSNYTALSGSPAGASVKKVLYPYLYFPGSAVISAITTGTTTTIDTASAHNFVVGQEVAFRIQNNWGTYQLNSLPNTLIPGSPIYGYVIAVTDYNTFVVNIDSTGYTAFNTNQTFAAALAGGLSFPQVVAVGDVNTGGKVISAGSPLYPSPTFTPIGTTDVSTINGPAIRGSYVNNTSQGFIVGVGAGTVLTTGSLVGAAGNVVYWRAYLHDINVVN